jgi:hypothetical protein
MLVYRKKKSENGDFLMSIRSLINLCEDVGLFLKAYWISAEDLGILKAPFILYAPDQNHFIALKNNNRLPWLSIPKRVVVITDQENDRFQELTEKEEKTLKGAKGDAPAPSMPQPQSAGMSSEEWAKALPKIYETQLKYAPLEAKQQVELAQQYAQPYGEAMKKAQEALYPGTSAIQETLANQSLEGMKGGLPDWAKEEYLSGVRANLGSNVGSGMAADYTSRGAMQMGEEWKRYNQNLGLSVTGRQPLTMAQTPQTSNYMQGFTPESVMGYNANIYGSQAQMFGAQAGMYNQRQASNASMFGSIMGMGGTMLGAGLGMYAAR